jgi:hypothetical protein
MRAIAILLFCLTSAACSSVEDLAPAVYVPPSMPTTEAAGKGIKQAATDAKITGPIEMSDLRQTDHGPGRFILCIRGVESKYSRLVTYAVFFDNNDYKGSRLPVMIDDCEHQAFRPYVDLVPAAAATLPSPTPAPVGKHHRARQQGFLESGRGLSMARG